jgi:hypothetical protein
MLSSDDFYTPHLVKIDELYMLICLEMMHDIFDEQTVTTNLRYISIRMSSYITYMLLLEGEKLNKLTSSFVDCICV